MAPHPQLQRRVAGGQNGAAPAAPIAAAGRLCFAARGLFKGADVAEAKGALGKGAAILMAIWVLLGVLPVLAQML